MDLDREKDVVRSERESDAGAGPTPSKSKVDVYLSRLSNLAQIVLVLLTAWALVYTVVPLYEKALVDEAVARQEIEIRRLQSDAGSLYAKNRSYILDGLLRSLKVTCGSAHIGSLINENDANPHLLLFESKIADCVILTLNENKDIEQLMPEDAELIKEKVTDVSDNLRDLQQDWRVKFDSAPAHYANSPDLLPPPGPYAQAVINELRLLTPDVDLTAPILESRMSQALGEIANQYYAAVQDEIDSLREVQWPAR